MVPGIVLVSRLFEDLPVPVVVPVSFATSVGIFALLGVPFLAMNLGLGLYLWVAGTIVAASLAAAALAGTRHKQAERPEHRGAHVRPSSVWLWAPYLLLCTALASVFRAKEPFPYDDIWVYLAWVREFLDAGNGALREPYFGDPVGASRARVNGWLFEQAALSRASGIDPVDLVLGYLVPTLVVMSLLAFYALARVLLRNETAALLVGSLYTLGLLLDLGGRWIGRVAEDKFLAWFLFLPVALIFAVLSLETGKKRYLVAFGFFCWAVVAVHPVGLAIIGLSAAGLGIVHLAVDWRGGKPWTGAAGLAGALLSVLLAPLLYLLATGESLVAALRSADISSGDPDVLANMVFVKPEWHRVLELGSGYYMVHPAQLLNPVVPVAFLVGLPFLLPRLKRSRRRGCSSGCSWSPPSCASCPRWPRSSGTTSSCRADVAPGVAHTPGRVPDRWLDLLGDDAPRAGRVAHLRGVAPRRPVLAPRARVRLDGRRRPDGRGQGRGRLPGGRGHAEPGHVLRSRLPLDWGPRRRDQRRARAGSGEHLHPRLLGGG
jgi:hypothetical protein